MSQEFLIQHSSILLYEVASKDQNYSFELDKSNDTKSYIIISTI